MPRSFYVIGSCLLLVLLGRTAVAQDYILDEHGEFVPESTPVEGTDEWVIAQAAAAIARDDAAEAKRLLNPWIEANKRTDNALLPRAYLLRGDAKILQHDEYEALYDYEAVIKQFPGSEEFQPAVVREMDIAQKYLDGMRRKLWGWIRVEPARQLGEELMIRAQERLPGSRVSEDAAIRLAEHYYKTRRLDLAVEMFDIFRTNYPDSDYAKQALLGQIYANVAQFKGPAYDASNLVEAELLLDRYVQQYPADALKSGIAEGLGSRIDESRAQQMLESARWYRGRGDDASAKFVFKRLLRRHPSTSAAQTALRTMQELGWIDEAEPAGATAQPGADQ
ncbi:MAG: outer membrane protein assembly factor BamD [Phycisphaeraceae bacterium]|nr:MAG: outer membrane protein assembly factor BamD [Phycisphaeraceae bacterium]